MTTRYSQGGFDPGGESGPSTGQSQLLPGATAATRYVGGTASGAPSTGTFATGDFVVDQSGQLWVCTAAGSPGTWQKIALGQPLGLTGATAATRYVGGTASVAPTTGTFAAGDFVVTQAGSIYICTAGGSPGTWAQVSGGGGGSSWPPSWSLLTNGNAAAPELVFDANGDIIQVELI